MTTTVTPERIEEIRARVDVFLRFCEFCGVHYKNHNAETLVDMGTRGHAFVLRGDDRADLLTALEAANAELAEVRAIVTKLCARFD